MQTFRINLKNGKPESITCLICDMTSYNPNDIEHRYCGMCNEFHEVLKTKVNMFKKDVLTPIKPQPMKGRGFFITAFALMVTMLIIGFVRMAINNTGIVAEFGVWPAAAICIATGLAGVFIGFWLVKVLKK